MEEQTLELLTQLANKLGTTAEKMWEVLVAQAQVEAVVAIAYLIISLVVIASTIIIHLKWSKKDEEGLTVYENSSHTVIVMIIMAPMSIFCFIAICVAIGTISVACLNPDYFALKMIMELL